MGKEKGKGMKASVALAAMIVVMAAAFVPVATAAVSLDITPDTNIAGAKTGYTVLGEVGPEDPGYSGCVVLNISIPKEFSAVEPGESGETIATAKFYGDGWSATVGAKSNDPNFSERMDVMVGGTPYTIDVNYGLGGGAKVGPVDNVEWTKMNITLMELKLPTAIKDGYFHANMTLPPGVTLTGFLIDTGPYVQNPSEPGLYTFHGKIWDCAGTLLDWEDGDVTIVPPAALPVLTPVGLLALVGILSIVLVGATMRRKAR